MDLQSLPVNQVKNVLTCKHANFSRLPSNQILLHMCPGCHASQQSVLHPYLELYLFSIIPYFVSFTQSSLCRCRGCDASQQSVRHAYLTDLAAYFHKAAPNQLVFSGTEGYFQGALRYTCTVPKHELLNAATCNRLLNRSMRTNTVLQATGK
jgi:hypothetical protein